MPSTRWCPGDRCAAGRRWEWDGVRFEFLHPPSGWGTARRNNQSCVLGAEAGVTAMLLTGDIERVAEALLVGESVKADAPRAAPRQPHCPARPSSTPWSALGHRAGGYRNRFGHPAREVLARYEGRVSVLRTDFRRRSERRAEPRCHPGERNAACIPAIGVCIATPCARIESISRPPATESGRPWLRKAAAPSIASPK